MKQDLREKLLKAGLIDKKSKKQADHHARIQRTQDARKGVDEDALLSEKERAFEEKVEKQRRRDRERDLTQQRRREEEAREKVDRKAEQEAARKHESDRLATKDRARDLLSASMFLPQSPGPVAFHFVSRSGGIRKLQLSTRIAHDLAGGRLAVAQLPGAATERFGLVRRDVALRLLEQDPTLVRFFVPDPSKDPADNPPPAEDPLPGQRERKAVKRFGPTGKGEGDRRDR